MKFLLLVSFLLTLGCTVYSVNLDFHHKDPPHKDCAGHAHNHGHEAHHHHFPAEKIAKLNNGDPIEADSSDYAQHLLCIWKEKGVMNEEGVLQKEVITSRVSKILQRNPEDAKKVEDCIVQKSTPAETAVSFYNCVAPFLKKYNSS